MNMKSKNFDIKTKKYKITSIMHSGRKNTRYKTVIDDKYDGLIHISEISNSFVKNIYDFVQIGEEIQARIIGIEEKTNQLKLIIEILFIPFSLSDNCI